MTIVPREGTTPPSTGAGRVRLVIVDDHEMVRESLVRLFGDEPGFEVAGSGATVAQAVATVAAYRPDVVVIDQQLPDGTGAQATSALVAASPTTRVLLLAGSADTATVLSAVRNGCHGCVEKTLDSRRLIAAVRAVSNGEIVMPVDRLETLPRLEDLALRYQPIVDIATGGIVGFEELLRWDHPTRGIVTPEHFLDVVEPTDLMVDIGTWMLDRAVGDWSRWPRRTPDAAPILSVNVSARELRQPDLPARVASALERGDMRASDLILEVTERTLVRDSSDAVGRLRALRALGLRLALDDFGTGYSSLAYLRAFPVEVIKIDKVFVDGLPEAERSVSLVRSICDLARQLGTTVIAEGVERPEQAAMLRELGCILAQGFLYSRPVDDDAAGRLLDGGAAPAGRGLR